MLAPFMRNEKSNYNDGSFELFLNYCVPIKFVQKTERHGDVRIFD